MPSLRRQVDHPGQLTGSTEITSRVAIHRHPQSLDIHTSPFQRVTFSDCRWEFHSLVAPSANQNFSRSPTLSNRPPRPEGRRNFWRKQTSVNPQITLIN